MIAAILEARRRSALSVSVACYPDSAAGREADIAIDVVVGPEFIAGSTRLKAGTAQKLVLNMLTTLAMVRSHKTYGNRMVDVRTTKAGVSFGGTSRGDRDRVGCCIRGAVGRRRCLPEHRAAARRFAVGVPAVDRDRTGSDRLWVLGRRDPLDRYRAAVRP